MMLALTFEMTGESGAQKCSVSDVVDGELYLVPPGTTRVVLRFGDAATWGVAPYARVGIGWRSAGDPAECAGDPEEDGVLPGPFDGVDALMFRRVA